MAPNTTIAVFLNIGHRAHHRTIPHPTGYTHDWEAYVSGVDDAKIECFVEKVIFTLHETFENPVQVVTSPPYSIKESGYASFGLKVDIHFNNKACQNGENIIHYEYDLYLPGEFQPAVKHFRQERLLFKNIPPDFRAMLFRGGAKETNDKIDKDDKNTTEFMAIADTKSSKMSDEEQPVKKKKHKAKSGKHKNSKAKSEVPDTSGSMFSISGSHDTKSDNSVKSGQIGGSSSSSASDSSSSNQSPSTQSGGSNSTSESDDDGNVNNNSSMTNKRISETFNSQGAKRSKTSERPTKKSPRNAGAVTKGKNGVRFDILLDLHEKIKATEDSHTLQSYIDVIEECSQYRITETSFDFDLCNMDAHIIHKLRNIVK